MNLRDLRYLVALSEHHHFGKAAKACFVSQPALSLQIKKLEETLGITLVERSNKTVLLTPIGQAITRKANAVLRDVDDMYDIAKLAEGPYSGELRVGIIPTLAPYLLPFVMPELTKKFSKLRFYLVEEQTEQLIQKLKVGTLDTALLALPVYENSFQHSLLFEEEFLVAVSSKHPLSKQKSIKQNDLSHEKVLLLEEGHCMRGQTLDLCRQINASENHSFRATSLETLRHMVAAGNGITLMPKLAQQTNDNISYIPFSEPKPTRSIGLYWRSSTVRGALFTQIATAIRIIMKEELHTKNIESFK